MTTPERKSNSNQQERGTNMSTNSVIAIPAGDGWRGRHVQWDGDPPCVGKQVFTVVQRDGLELARRTFIETYYGWSTVNADRPDISKIRTNAEDRKLARTSPWELREKYGRNHPKLAKLDWNDSGQFVNVPGYGVAYSSCVLNDIGPGYTQSEAGDWVDQSHTDDWKEWAYVLADNGLWILKGHHQEDFELLGVVPWDADPSALTAIYERWAEGVPSAS
jgi:hypothetical protein